MMSDDLQSCLKSCREIRRDVSHGIASFSFEKQGWTISYAVDFSEIFAYAKPEESAYEIRLFLDKLETAVENIAIQSNIFDIIFSAGHSTKKLVLLDPYMVELRQFIEAEQSKR